MTTKTYYLHQNSFLLCDKEQLGTDSYFIGKLNWPGFSLGPQ